jgi:NAD(P)-dependent dehydrogenase (short-subunit alcohol dehydrogenase family)
MQDLMGKTAVVTGAGGGIGRALAERFASEGMRLALTDIDADALTAVAAALDARGCDVLAIPADVANRCEIKAFADEVFERFQRVHILCNNAGVRTFHEQPLWEVSAEEWDWVMGVNLFGVLNGIRSFVPRMIKHGEPGHVVNMSSVSGFVSYPHGGPYNTSKHGVITVSETMHYELEMRRSNVRVSVACPSWVKTNILEAAERTGPAKVREPALQPSLAVRDRLQREVEEKGLEPEEVATAVLEGIRDERFYIFTHPEEKPMIDSSLRDVIQQRNPTLNRRSRLGRLRSRLVR